MSQLIQIAGSLLILAGFALSQWGVLNPKSVTYLTINAIGAAVLAIQGATEAQWGFVMLEGVWSIVSGVGLIRLWSARRSIGKERAIAGS
jgi:hypothetical protein